MTHAIKIGKVIREQLMADSNIVAKIENKAFPLIAENDTTFPFICYTRETINPEQNTKDGYVGDRTNFRIDVVSNSYNECVDISDLVRELFEKRIINSITHGMQLQDCYMSGINEFWDSNTYITQLRFTCVVKNLVVQKPTN